MVKTVCWQKNKTGGKVTAKQFAQFTKEAAKPQANDVDDYKLDRELSNKWVQVYHNPKLNHTIVYHRGSADKADAWTDVKLFFGQTNNNRFHTSERIQKAAQAKYGTENLSTLGSSLGGYLAQQYGGDGAEIITSGKPVTPGDFFKGRQRKPNQYDVRTDADPVAIGQNLQKKTGREILIPSSNKLAVLDNHLAENVMAKLPEDFSIGNPNIGVDFNSTIVPEPRIGGKVTTFDLKAFIKANKKKAGMSHIRITKMRKAQLRETAQQIATALAK